MWRSYNEDWERRKEYIFRTLFKDISLLSTVSEEEGTPSESSSHLSPSSVKAKRSLDAAQRPWTPLPPLIVEREPNKHDEPEEHYRLLGQKMRRLYKWLFIENHSLNSSFNDYVTGENSEEFPSIETLNKTFIVEDREELSERLCTGTDLAIEETDPLGPTHSSNRNVNDTKKMINSGDNILESDISSGENYSKTPESSTDDGSVPKSSEVGSGYSASEENTNKTEEKEYGEKLVFRSSSSSVSSDPGGCYQQITIQAQVHREALAENDTRLDMVYEERVSKKHNRERDYDDFATLERNRVSDLPILKQKGTSSEYLDLGEIEVMRTPRDHCIRTSCATSEIPPRQDSTEFLSPKFTSPSVQDLHSFDILRVGSNTSKTEQCSDDFNKLLHSSTPRPNIKRRNNVGNISDYTYSTTSSHKRGRYENAAVQVNENMEWNSVEAIFFKGIPKLFRLCSCKDHRCLC